MDVRETWSTGNRMIVVHHDYEGAPHVYTEDEAEEMYEQLGEILGNE